MRPSNVAAGRPHVGHSFTGHRPEEGDPGGVGGGEFVNCLPFPVRQITADFPGRSAQVILIVRAQGRLSRLYLLDHLVGRLTTACSACPVMSSGWKDRYVNSPAG